MRCSDVVTRLKARERELRARGVRRLAIYGPAARSEIGLGSDVDLLVDLDHEVPLSALDLSELRLVAGNLIGTPVDIVIRTQLPAGQRERVESEAVRVF
jgi:predicted nucleotidyltransferase